MPAGAASTSHYAAPLDGKIFRASIVPEDANEDSDEPLGDQLIFSGGDFSSAICRRYNFAEAPYRVRVEPDRIHFLAELASPTKGTMVWEGTVRGNTLEGTMRWTKRRWYWTIVAEHKISGTLDETSDAAMPPRN